MTAVTSHSNGDQAFPQTRWSLVQSSTDESLNELCAIYWKPIYGFVRRSGFSAADAEDLTQAFFAKLVSDESLRRADRDRGKLRSFLLGAVRRHLVDFRRHRGAQKRGADAEHLPIATSEHDFNEAEEQVVAHVAEGLSPDQLFDQCWALELLRRAHQRLRDTYQSSNKLREYELLKSAVTTSEALDYSAAMTELKISQGHARVLAHRLRKNFRAAVKDEVADTVSQLADVDQELRELLNVFS